MSSRPRRLVPSSTASCVRSALSNAAAHVRSSLLPRIPSPLGAPGPARGLPSADAASRLLSAAGTGDTPAAWQHHRLGPPLHQQAPIPLPPSAAAPMAAVLRPTALLPCGLSSTREGAERHDVAVLSHSALPLGPHESARGAGPLLPRSSVWGPALPLSAQGTSRGVLARAEGEVARVGGEAWGLLGSPVGGGCLAPLGSLSASSLGPLRASCRKGEQRRGKAVGPLLAHHTLRAASSFHFLHGGLADVAALGFSSPLDGSVKSRSVHDVRAEQPGPSFSVAAETEACPADETSDSSASEPAAAEPSLKLVSGACALPHPDKAEKGGEDAFFISSACQAIGVADGVGGWADVGVDAGAYARELMSEALKAVEGEVPGKGTPADPLQALSKAHAKTTSQGSSTACLVLLTDQQKLSAANLGDSGFMIIRSGRTIFKSPPQQHDFNFPYQLGSAGGDPPNTAEVFNLPVAAGDVVVLGTDGLFDNVFDGELASMVMHSLMAGRSPQSTAEHIAALARIRAADRVRFSPFARAAMEAGYRYYGGKMDDITVVVSYVTSGGTAK